MASVPRGAAVVARALAPLAELIELAFPLLVGAGGSLVAWKSASALGPGGGDELGAARRAIAAIDPGRDDRGRAGRSRTAPARPSADLADHRLVVVTRRATRSTASWPRDPAARKRRPW